MNQQPVYLDYNATTPVDPRVVEAMLPYLSQRYGNASSAHVLGFEAHEAIERARSQVASLIGAHPDEIVFTAGGSETDNLAIKGVVFANLARKPHVITTAVEHPAVLNTLRYLQRRFSVDSTVLPVDAAGRVTPEQVHAALRPETVLVTIMHANNEVGTLQGLAEIASVTRARDVYLHADAAQSAGKVPIDVRRLGVDLLTIAGHKLYAPKGIGAVYVRRGVELDPLVHGSGQERGLRAGTENVPSIVALGLAAELSAADLEGEAQRLTGLRDALFQRLSEAVPGLQLNGDAPHRLPNTLNVSFPGTLGQTVLACAPDLAASTGSACHSGRTEASPVLSAMGLPRERALGAVRLSLGRWTTPDDVDRAVDLLSAAYRDAVGAPVTMG